jgi:transposase InsO family protein
MKDEALDCFKIYKAEAENQLEGKIKCVRSNRGEFISNDFGEYCAEHGIIHETMAPYSPQSSGVVERKIQHLRTWLMPCWSVRVYPSHGGEKPF